MVLTLNLDVSSSVNCDCVTILTNLVHITLSMQIGYVDRCTVSHCHVLTQASANDIMS